MRSKLSYLVLALTSVLLLSVFAMLPASGFVYPNGAIDTQYEYYGPHADYMQFVMFASDTSMWQALGQGQLDIVDWPLTTSWRTNPPPAGFLGDPNVMMVDALGEAGFYVVDFNEQKYPEMGETADGRGNPVYTNITGYSKSIHGVPGIPPISTNPYFRVAVSCLLNKPVYLGLVGIGGTNILTPIPSYMTGWIWAGAYAYPYSRTWAEGNFTLGRVFQDKTVSPWVRYWDYNENGVRDTGEAEACVLKFTWRMDANRRIAGEMLYDELSRPTGPKLYGMNFTFAAGLYGPKTSGENYQQVMLDKNYHISTLGWINVGPDPDHMYDLYHVTSYWDDPSSSSPNTACLNDTILNAQAEMIKFATNPAAAKPAADAWQSRFLQIAAQIPLISNARVMPNRKYYSGGNAETLKSPDDGENIFRRKGDGSKREWLGIANQAGYGTNSWWSHLNMYPNCTLYSPESPGLGHMTIRYGWKEQGHPEHINPFYSEWYWDAVLLAGPYDGLGYRNPYNLQQWRADLIKNWTVGTWQDGPATRSKVTVTLKPGIYFTDGYPLTTADVVFSLVEAGQLLEENGFQPPWWWPTGELVRSMSKIDPYTVEILFDVTSYMVESWTLGGFYIVPKHIWKPLIESGDPTVFCPDPNVIGSGPWRYISFTPTLSVVMQANKPGTAAQTDRAGSREIITPGYKGTCPVYVDVHLKAPYEYDTKVNIPHAVGVAPPTTTSISFKVTLIGQWFDASDPLHIGELLVNKYVYVDGVLQPGFPQDHLLIEGEPDVEQFTIPIAKCNHTLKVAVHIKGPTTLSDGHPNPWLSQWINVTQIFWVTIEEDIAGTKFLADFLGFPSLPYKNQVPAPDCRVDMSDVYDAATAFGSNPGHPRWKSHADITRDYRVDMSDIYNIAKMFGKWT